MRTHSSAARQSVRKWARLAGSGQKPARPSAHAVSSNEGCSKPAGTALGAVATYRHSWPPALASAISVSGRSRDGGGVTSNCSVVRANTIAPRCGTSHGKAGACAAAAVWTSSVASVASSGRKQRTGVLTGPGS